MKDPFLSDLDLYLFSEGKHERLYEKLGAHPTTRDNQPGVHFAVWAPNATRVSVIGDFNHWQPGQAVLEKRGLSGIWEGFVPGLENGARYKYRVEAPNFSADKSDPYGFWAEKRPATASRVFDLDGYTWTDDAWMKARGEHQAADRPMSVYEVHLGSWRRNADGTWMTYAELGDLLADYVTHLGFTHVELMPIAEHPFDGSWGYQTTGYFAPTSRHGNPHEFMAFVDRLHRAGIGVILDWVPAHFPMDAHALGLFDGTHLYEHADPRQGKQPDWDTYVFNYGRPEVLNFLTSNALYWLDAYHIDGIRVDAVAAMLYLDYSRKPGEWVPNRYGGRENLESIAFLRRFNELVYAKFPSAMTIAEESTSWPSVTRPTYLGGLGFGRKWDMGWMHDTLDYFHYAPIHRKYHHRALTFRMVYAFTENWVLPLSHDEVVYGKGSLIGKMPGDDWQKFANLRLLFAWMIGQPGKKLIFMGGEFGQRREWNHDAQLVWESLGHPFHSGLQQWLRDLNHFYKANPALWQDDVSAGFQWIDCNDTDQSCLTFLRQGKDPLDQAVFAFNFTEIPRHNYRVGVSRSGRWNEALNSDAPVYSGSGVGNWGGQDAQYIPCHGRPFSLSLSLPPLGATIFTPAS